MVTKIFWRQHFRFAFVLLGFLMCFLASSHMAYASEYVEWDEYDDSIPTQSINEGETKSVTVSPEGEVHSFCFTPNETGYYLFYTDSKDNGGPIRDGKPKGRVRTIDSSTGNVDCLYIPEWRYGSCKWFLVRFKGVKGKKYYLDTKLTMTQTENVSYEVTVKRDKYESVVYKPKNRVELLYNESGKEVHYSNDKVVFEYSIGAALYRSRGQFEFTKNEGTKDIYKYLYDLDTYREVFVFNDTDIYDAFEDWRYYSDQDGSNQWGLGQHEFIIYIDGKKVTIPVWVVSEYSYDPDYVEEDEDIPSSSDNNQGNAINTFKFTVKYDSMGGTKVKDQTKRKAVKLKLTTAIPKHKTKIFLGWATSKNGKVVYKPGSFYNTDDNITLYAKWRSGETSKSNISTTGLKKAKKKYSKLKTMLAKGTYPIPGLKTSCVRTDGGKYLAECSHMVPQGICTAKGNIFITAYCSNKEHNSVIHVLNAKNGKYKGTVTLQDKNHCGGIAYDGKGYLWIAKSTTGKVSAISVNEVASNAKNNDAPLIKYEKKLTFTCKSGNKKNSKAIASASFVTFYGNNLWVGYCTKNSKKAKLYGYKVKYKSDKPCAIQYKQTWPISHHANGASFVKKGGKKYLIISSEAGRNVNSELISYLANDDGKKCSFKKKKTVTLPPLHEELDVSGDKILSIYESGAKEYRGDVKNKAVVGVVCVGDKKQILKMLNIK